MKDQDTLRILKLPEIIFTIDGCSVLQMKQPLRKFRFCRSHPSGQVGANQKCVAIRPPLLAIINHDF